MQMLGEDERKNSTLKPLQVSVFGPVIQGLVMRDDARELRGD